RYAYLKMGERDVDNAMPWDKIDPATYTVWDKTANFNKAIVNSKSRIEHNSQFKLIEENAKWIDSRGEDNTYSLNMEKFKMAQNAIEETAKKYRPIIKYKNALKFTSLPYELVETEKDSVLKEKRERWHEGLSKDIYVEEALNVLDDLQSTVGFKKNLPAKIKKEKLAKS
ncbi:MAG TPA: carboxy terminal-processing peptidase, partial [Flavobacterium sp.]|uniref:carboxy terminal-processing peptidase n=1 Tax=Flavobacterium sp. TaxID=239 RepID=UPI002F41803C